MEWLIGVSLATGRQLGLALGPLAVVALLMHGIDTVLASRVTSRLGWRGVFVTGWLGVPVHELSHAAACCLFGHRVRRVRLFAPDAATGQLGSVTHSYDARSPRQQVGRFFIGVAPLVGGSLVLWLLTLALAPAGAASLPLGEPGASTDTLALASSHAGQLLRRLLSVEALGSWVTWLYLYLCLCVASHMAPSATDLRGCWSGLALLVIAVAAANGIVLGFGGSTAVLERGAVAAASPLFVLLVLALALELLCLLGVWALTAPFPSRAAGGAPRQAPRRRAAR